MASRTRVVLIDDLDGQEVLDGEGGKVTFGYAGTEWEIDLRQEHITQLEEALAPFRDKARRVRGRASQPGRGRASAATNGSASPQHSIREWANANGYQVSSRGRIPAQVQEAYQAAH